MVTLWSLFEEMRAPEVILADWLSHSPKPFTGLLAELGTVTVTVTAGPGTRSLTEDEAFRLGGRAGQPCRYRNGLLRVGGQAAASTALLWLPGRLPPAAAALLEAGEQPAGEILAPYGMRRVDRRAGATRMIEEVTGEPGAVLSTAVLEVRGKLGAITHESVTRRFAEALTAGAAI